MGLQNLQHGQMSRILANEHSIKHIWTRIFSVYGPYDGQKTMVMSSIKNMVDHNLSLEYTEGKQMWDYIYSKDVAKAFYLIAKRGKNNSTYCIASGKSRPLYTYIEDIKNTINPNIKLKLGIIPYSDKQVMNLCADITDLTKDTGFTPTFNFVEGIQETIKWYKESSDKYEKN